MNFEKSGRTIGLKGFLSWGHSVFVLRWTIMLMVFNWHGFLLLGYWLEFMSVKLAIVILSNAKDLLFIRAATKQILRPTASE